ncbi:MAG: type II toxin-antitoxin system VapC family toxin [Candidatus Brocadiae bacterium]|nr:type II toxin-antitoxin system VapC family toxin [Candidatus Brocadiia bacterium]
MKPRVYIETSVVSYLVGRPHRDMVIAARQQLTHQWWDERSARFHLVISELVHEEAAQGDPGAAAARLAATESLPILKVNQDAVALAEQLVSQGPIPHDSAADALHIAIAAVNGIDYVLTWNCKHLANAMHRSRIEELVEDAGYTCPVICTPEELMED